MGQSLKHLLTKESVEAFADMTNKRCHTLMCQLIVERSPLPHPRRRKPRKRNRGPRQRPPLCQPAEPVCKRNIPCKSRQNHKKPLQQTAGSRQNLRLYRRRSQGRPVRICRSRRRLGRRNRTAGKNRPDVSGRNREGVDKDTAG